MMSSWDGAMVGFKQASNSFQFWGGPCPYPSGGSNGAWSGGLSLARTGAEDGPAVLDHPAPLPASAALLAAGRA